MESEDTHHKEHIERTFSNMRKAVNFGLLVAILGLGSIYYDLMKRKEKNERFEWNVASKRVGLIYKAPIEDTLLIRYNTAVEAVEVRLFPGEIIKEYTISIDDTVRIEEGNSLLFEYPPTHGVTEYFRLPAGKHSIEAIVNLSQGGQKIIRETIYIKPREQFPLI